MGRLGQTQNPPASGELVFRGCQMAHAHPCGQQSISGWSPSPLLTSLCCRAHPLPPAPLTGEPHRGAQLSEPVPKPPGETHLPLPAQQSQPWGRQLLPPSLAWPKVAFVSCLSQWSQSRREPEPLTFEPPGPGPHGSFLGLMLKGCGRTHACQGCCAPTWGAAKALEKAPKGHKELMQGSTPGQAWGDLQLVRDEMKGSLLFEQS